MKSKKIPRSIIAWLILMGFWGGNVGACITVVLWITFGLIAWLVWMAIVLGALGLWSFIGWKWNDTLVEYGLAKPKKDC